MRGTLPTSRRRSLFLLVPALLLGACRSVPTAPRTAPAAPTATGKPQPAAPAVGSHPPAMPAAGSGRGGYYQDDGPGENPPTNLLAVPDAEPKIEPVYPNASRPYVVFGKTYSPIGTNAPLKQRGIGSWYGRKFHGQKTSSGERYDMYKMTAAHTTMPLPSYARVTNLSNGKQVIVRVNDRGPFHSSRIIDLSYTAALKLGYIGKGSTELEVERLLPDEIARMAKDRLGERAVALREPASQPVSTVPLTTMASASVAVPVVPNEQPPSTGVESLAAPVVSTQPMQGASLKLTDGAPPNDIAPVVATSDVRGTSLKPIASPTLLQEGLGFYLQLGAFSQPTNADGVRARVQRDNGSLPPLELVQGGGVFRLFSGPFLTREEAELAALKIQQADGLKPFIVLR